ncbi:MAG: hypothetical protein HY320_07765 [Armatimonadetes bacterium]|nr:hypothetical protein [Armatimonadota bacterium]
MELRHQVRRLRALSWISLAAIPGSWLGWAVVGALAPPSRVIQDILAVTGIVLVVPVLPMLLLTARDCRRRSRSLAADLSRGHVLRFAGVVDSEQADPDLKCLLRHRLLDEDSASAQWFEALPVSGRIWQANGVRPRRWAAVSWTRVAEPPAHAAIAAEWVSLPEAASPEALHTGARELSFGEKEELSRIADRLLRSRLLAYSLISAWFGMAVLSLIVHILTRDPFRYYPIATVVAVFWLLATGDLWRRVHLARRLRRDRQFGQVIIVRAPRDGQTSAGHGAPELGPPVEVLPQSGVIWTEGGQPSVWRRSALK